jgi:hypothetical protein
MYVGHQEEVLAKGQHREYTRAADDYRTIMNAPRAYGQVRERFGSLLLRWGRALCERDGRVSVEIAFTPATKDHHTPDAA